MDNNYAYDSMSKRLLSKKSIICNIMKECIPEYKNLSRKEIIECIEDGGDGEYINGLNSESINDEEKRVAFDILFTSKLPDSNERIGMYIDLETQNRINPGYDLLDRAIYYASRLIDNQKGKTFEGSNYDDIKKVYSIWICTNPKVEQKDSINQYSLVEECIKGDYHSSIDYKKINIIMLYVGDNYNYNFTGVLEMLSLIFKKVSLKVSSIIKELNDSYDIILNEKEVSTMSNLSQGLIEQGIQQGIQQGIIQTVFNVIKSGYSLEDAFKITNADKSVQKIILEKLNEEER